MGSENVLKRLLKPQAESELIEKFLHPKRSLDKAPKKPGRPSLADEKKARNFTLCLAPQYISFLDRMTVKDPKVQGRGRKIRFIIDRFIEHERRSLEHMKVLKNSLHDVQEKLSLLGGRVKKGEKLVLSMKEKENLSKVIEQVYLLLKILNYSPKELQKRLSREDWSILSFVMDWKNRNGVKF